MNIEKWLHTFPPAICLTIIISLAGFLSIKVYQEIGMLMFLFIGLFLTIWYLMTKYND